MIMRGYDGRRQGHDSPGLAALAGRVFESCGEESTLDHGGPASAGRPMQRAKAEYDTLFLHTPQLFPKYQRLEPTRRSESLKTVAKPNLYRKVLTSKLPLPLIVM